MSPLPAIPTAESATAQLPAETFASLASFLDAWTEAGDWRDRMDLADVLLTEWADVPATSFRTDAGCKLLTALLEQSGEREIDCVEAAALYRVSHHPMWRLAAMRWFAAHDSTVGDFIDAHPAWAIFAGQCAVLHGLGQ